MLVELLFIDNCRLKTMLLIFWEILFTSANPVFSNEIHAKKEMNLIWHTSIDIASMTGDVHEQSVKIVSCIELW